ncbi:MAG: hypothetical protein Q8N83_07815 [Ignavibacteria bacterium]|nr:hypothetical protein [Ignavibacteria bacterium]
MRNFIFSLLLPVTILFNSSFAQELEITLTLDKTNYLKFETIESIAELKNISSQIVIVTEPFNAEIANSGIEILLLDSTGNTMRSIGRTIIHGYLEEQIKLLPEQCLVSFIHVTQSGFGQSIQGGGTRVALENSYLPAGEYKLQLSYNYFIDKLKNTIYSNIYKFIISEPNESDLDIFNKIKKITEKQFSLPKTLYPESVKTIFNKYPNHVYTLSVYENFITTSYQKESDQQEYLLKMIEDQPSSFLTLRSVIGCPKISEDFRNTASARLKVKSELNKTMLEKYENYKKIINRK